MSTISSIHTPCKDCVFAIYDNITQTECALKYIDKYKNQNIEILEAYDDTKEFYIINNKKCIGYRENKWFKQFDLDQADLDSKIQKYKETNILDYMIIIDLKNLSIDELEDLIQQTDACAIKPKKVILIRYNDNELRFPYSSIEKILKDYNVSYEWRIQTILDTEWTYDHILSNITSSNLRYRFTVSVTKYSTDLCRIINATNKLVHEDLGQFEVISNAEKTCLIYSGAIYRFESFHGKNLLNNDDNYKIL